MKWIKAWLASRLIQFGFVDVSIILVFVGFLLYGHVIHYPFVHDDYIFIVGNFDLQRWDHLKNIFLSPSFSFPDNPSVMNSYYRPVLDVVNKVLFLAFERIPRGYHLFNILLHILNSLWVYWLAARFSRRKFLAFGLSFLFLIHPVQAEAVCAIAGVSNLLSAFFCFTSLFFYLKRDDFHFLGERGSLLVLSLFFFCLGLLTKESTMALPLALVFYELIFHNALQKENNRFGKLFAIVSFFVLLIGYVVFRHFIVRQALPDIGANLSELGMRLASIPETLLMYMRILVFPADLHYYRSVDILQFSFFPTIILIVFSILTVTLLARFPKQEKRLAYFGLGFFFITLSPMLNIVPLVNEYSLILTSEHFLYFSCFGFFLFIFIVIRQMFNFIFKSHAGEVLGIIFVFVSVIFFFIAKEQTRYWQGEIPLFRRTLEYHPNFGRVRILLARAYYFEHHYEAAAEEYKKAISIIGDYFTKTKGSSAQGTYRLLLKEAHFELAHCYEAIGRVDQAIDEYRRAEEMDPSDDRIYNNLGINYLYLGNLGEAAVCFEKALALDPKNVMALNNLAFYYLQIGKFERAEDMIRQVLVLDPKSVSAQKNLEEALKAQGKGQKEN